METLYELCSSGQSGALFYYTKDRKYMLKTIPEREFIKLRSVLREYLEYLTENPILASLNSLVCINYNGRTQKNKHLDAMRMEW